MLIQLLLGLKYILCIHIVEDIFSFFYIFKMKNVFKFKTLKLNIIYTHPYLKRHHI